MCRKMTPKGKTMNILIINGSPKGKYSIEIHSTTKVADLNADKRKLVKAWSAMNNPDRTDSRIPT